MWFWFAVIALLFWSGSDLFSKIGCQDGKDKYSHLKMVTAVGVVMGLHAAYEIFIGGVEINLHVILTYLPVSMLYILSMAMGYLGLRYIELSISSPICNSSGAVVAVLTFATVGISDELPPVALVAVALVCLGVIALGITESTEDEELRRARQDASNHHYAKSWIAIVIPVIYCLLDALTFLAVGIICAVYVLGIKKQKLIAKQEAPKYTGAVCETIGQFFYIYALADSEHVAFAAPIISSYCVASVIWGRIFLKEKLSKKHYASIALVVVGIVILGILDI